MQIKRREGKKMKGTFVELPEELYRWIKHHAVDQDVSLKAVVQKAIEEYRARKGGGKK
jgi:hemerythrin